MTANWAFVLTLQYSFASVETPMDHPRINLYGFLNLNMDLLQCCARRAKITPHRDRGGIK